MNNGKTESQVYSVSKRLFLRKFIVNELLYQGCGMLIVMQRLTSLMIIVVNDKYAFCREFAAGVRRSYVSPVRHIAAL
jgi:hypothetical protein